MRLRVFSLIGATLCALVAISATGFTSYAHTFVRQDSYKTQEQEPKNKPAQISEAENKALLKINSAPDAAAKIQAAGEFLKKYPKSIKRNEVALHVAGEVAKVQDTAQQITLSESFITVFNQPGDADLINPILIDAYVKSNRIEDAFKVGANLLAKNPNDVVILTNLAIVGTEQVKRQNGAFMQQSRQYATKAIELIESGKKPDTFDDARWTEYKTRWLPYLYQAVGLLSLVNNNKEDAKTNLEKAISFSSPDPFSYVLLGTLANEEYQKLAEQHKALMAGPLKDDVLKQAEAKMDQIIDLYAHAVALSAGNPAYQKMQEQILQDLTHYYKYRHKGSTDGLQQLIDKYKKPASN